MEIHNHRDVLAHLDATRCCVIDHDTGAHNLFVTDRIVPGGSHVNIREIMAGYVNINLLGARFNRAAPAAEDSQRLLLRVRWEDGETEDVDVTYHAVAIDND